MALSLHQRKKFLFDQLRHFGTPKLRDNPEPPAGRWIGRGDVRMECELSGDGRETPARFRFGHEPREITEVKESWLAPNHCFFKVGTDDGSEYILRHDRRYDLWEIATFAELDIDVPSTD